MGGGAQGDGRVVPQAPYELLGEWQRRGRPHRAPDALGQRGGAGHAEDGGVRRRRWLAGSVAGAAAVAAISGGSNLALTDGQRERITAGDVMQCAGAKRPFAVSSPARMQVMELGGTVS